jgi:nicotinate-nucleotide pyrophosphorylase (carboxylating)
VKDDAFKSAIADDVRRALAEDLGTGDVTAALLPAEGSSAATVITREDAVLCGTAWFDAVFAQLDATVRVSWLAQDGDAVEAGQELCRLYGPTRALLSGERCALNFLQTLSATATATRRYVAAVAGTGAQILDTRKTIPGLRAAQKYAVHCGGGRNHRMGLYDAILIKENHIAAAGSIERAVSAARQLQPGLGIEVEVENLAQLQQAIAVRADIILLDNFSLDDMHAAVAVNAGRAKLEASGGITLDNVRLVASTGVDFISVGALTKHLRAVDLSLRMNNPVQQPS